MEKKVLLVADDEEMNRRIISRFLKDTYDVLEAEDGVSTMAMMAKHRVDGLLLDIIMPEMDGLEVLRAMRQQPELAGVGVLVATSTKEKTERMALSLGADDVVAKPYDPLVIRKRMENILAMKEMERQRALLSSGSFEAMLGEKWAQWRRDAEQADAQIAKCVRIIEANKENYSLVGEMLAEIKRQSRRFVTMTDDKA